MGEHPLQAAVVTVSDGVAEGVRRDASGRAVAALLEASGYEVADRSVVPDDAPTIQDLLRRLADSGVPLVVTTGGTGLGPRDVTPEATRAVIEREAPGLAEEMRATGRGSSPFAALSRGVVGARGSSLIVNLPGSEAGATQSLQAILPVLPHALRLLAGHTVHGPAPHDDHGHRAEPATGPTVAAGSVEEELVARRARGEDLVLATAIRTTGSPPCQVGQKVLLSRRAALAGTLGCAEFDDGASAEAPGVLDAGEPRTSTYLHDLGSVEVYLEPFIGRPRLVVFSATPVARALIRWGRDLGFDPVLVEPRAERLTSDDRGGPVLRSAEEAALDRDGSVVCTDHDATGLVDALAVFLRSPARFIGLMGSRRHVGPHLDRLRELGFGEEDLARIRTPVGLDIGARTPAEIALSILAGVVADRRGARAGWLDR